MDHIGHRGSLRRDVLCAQQTYFDHLRDVFLPQLAFQLGINELRQLGMVVQVPGLHPATYMHGHTPAGAFIFTPNLDLG